MSLREEILTIIRGNTFECYDDKIRLPVGAVDEIIALCQPQWISVDERLPEDHGLFLTATGSGTILLHVFNTDDGWSAMGKDHKYWNMVTTHWMPLPAPPERNDG